MNAQDLPDPSETPLCDLVQSLANFQNEHLQMLADATTTEHSPTDAVRHLIAAALRRSAALVDGFLAIVDARNRFCAIPLIRLQLDSAMRIRACRIVADATAFVTHVLEGRQPSKYPEKGVDLHDRALHEALTSDHPFTSDLYQETNGYVHLSNHHLFGLFDETLLNSGVVRYTDHEALPPWGDSCVKGTVLSMVWATHVLTEECNALMRTFSEIRSSESTS